VRNLCLAASLFIAGCVTTPDPPEQQLIHYGDNTHASIGMAAEVDEYGFDGNAGEVVTLVMVVDAGTMWSRIDLLDPSGTKITDARHPTRARIDTVRLTETGRYAVLAMDGFDSTRTGRYGLSVQRTADPGSAIPITYGSGVQSSIDSTAQIAAYTFEGNAGDIVTMLMAVDSGTLWCGIEIYDPSGTRIAEAIDPSDARVDGVGLATTGRHAILVTDGFDGKMTGRYGLSLQRTADPGNATSIAYGAKVGLLIDSTAQIDAYTFDGNADDVVTIIVAADSGNLWPRVELYNTAGTRIAGVTDPTNARIDTVRLASTGRHAILAMDGFNGPLQGRCSLSLSRAKSGKPEAGVPASSGLLSLR